MISTKMEHACITPVCTAIPVINAQAHIQGSNVANVLKTKAATNPANENTNDRTVSLPTPGESTLMWLYAGCHVSTHVQSCTDEA